jgi:tetratricopeptide (TPR) repeat protein
MDLQSYNEGIDKLLYANELKSKIGTNGESNKIAHEILQILNEAKTDLGEESYILASISEFQFRLGYRNNRWYEDAILSITKALSLEPNSSFLHTMLAEYYELALIDYAKAAKEIREAIRLNPYNLRALNDGASLNRYPGDYVTLGESISWLEKLIELEPNEPNRHAFLAEQYLKDGKVEEAKKEARRSLSCSLPLKTGWIEIVKRILKPGA